MPELSRPDGTRIHYEVNGEAGPRVVLATYWSWTPGVWAELLADLASDHRVVTYHLRGTGVSSRNGPHDSETDIGDLEALLDAVGGASMLLSTADSANRAAKLGSRRPDLIDVVLTFGAGPFAVATFQGLEAMVSSESVLGAFVEMLEHSYRGGMRTLIEATNPQLGEDEVRERLDALVDFCPQAAALERLRTWIADDPRRESQALGERLWIFTAPGVAGPWLPPWEDRKRLIEETMPDARVFAFEQDAGPISAPHVAAEEIRRITAPLRAGLAEERK